MARGKHSASLLSRRALLKGMGLAPLAFRAAPFFGSPLSLSSPDSPASANPSFPFADIRLRPHYPAKSPLADVLRLVAPGTDSYVTEKYAFEISAILRQWSEALKSSPGDLAPMATALDPAIQASTFSVQKDTPVRSGQGITVLRRQFSQDAASGRDRFLKAFKAWLGPASRIETAELQITGIEEKAANPLSLSLEIRYDFVLSKGSGPDEQREERVGFWQTAWTQSASQVWTAHDWQVSTETISRSSGPGFIDVTAQALGATESYTNQLLRGVDYWRTVLDGASGIDVYGNNGVAIGDFDNDGFDDLYVCQPAGLPNRLYRNRGDGTFEDVTEKSGLGVLDGTACALFADFDNRGLQDLLVVCGSGPLFFRNQGDGTFAIKRDALQFAQQPQGTFTHAALADYDRDGRLDIYFCTYSYYVGLDQYHYPVPYYDARNGPANFLLHNEGNGRFVDRTEASGLSAENDRYSFACAWGDFDGDGWPDLTVANDFGRGNLYRNNGNGTFSAVSQAAHIGDPGAGMSASWSDYDNDGKPDFYVANMWSAAGQRISAQKQFHQNTSETIRGYYHQHARGNALYRNLGEGKFQNVCQPSGVEMGRWSWCSDFWDFDHDGYPDLYIANGYISAPDLATHEQNDLGSFFWRQVVAKSPEDSTPSLAYEHGWSALNELIRSDISWNGYERNVMFANNRDGTFSEVSGVVGLDFPQDSRSFALADLNHDGRLEVILKNRNSPQLRILHNSMKGIGDSIAFRLRGHQSNRDAIGAAITVEAGSLRQTRYLQAGSGFLAQHSKEVFFGLGNPVGKIRATVQWPNGLKQTFEDLPASHRIQIEEGSSRFEATAFSASAFDRAVPPPSAEPLPAKAETWLIEPLKAPEFSLPDMSGNVQALSSFQGSPVVLNFWVTKSSTACEQLRLFQQHRTALSISGLRVIAINADDPGDRAAATSFAEQEKLAFPVLFATEEMAGIYNIIYRYLFDRRRDLPFPISFLLDKGGKIVRVYQGSIDPRRLIEDAKAMPATTTARLEKALPLGGVLYQGAFQRNDFTYGVALFQHGYFDQAAESFQQVVAAKPNDPEGFYNLGTLSLRRNDFAKARQYLEKTLKLRPDYPEAWNNLGMMAAQEGHPDQAIQNFEQSLQLRPGYAIALLNLGNIYRRQGNFTKAAESLNQAIQLQPDDPEINYSLGMMYAQQGQLSGAADWLRKAVELRPDYPEALNNLGVIFVRSQDYAQAEAQFKTAIRLAPSFDQSYLNLARLYAIQQDRARAIDILQQLLALQPQNLNASQALKMLQ